MIAPLTELIAEARGLANDHPCTTSGHAWDMDGGRSCPKNLGHCSQPVFRCARCGEWDYGNPGGPGHHFCFSECVRQARITTEDGK
ncbi:hypothetical protein [Burkholderia gladioli]|uniref:hypothetical protein n=1 Tax=Burkholderia gladioli TaxID=28095 RepID=UPI000A477964|nr:hypothetical protein [Burkholderia gladioli]